MVFLFTLPRGKSQEVQSKRDIKLLTRHLCLLTMGWVAVPELSWTHIFGRLVCDGKGLKFRSEVERQVAITHTVGENRET